MWWIAITLGLSALVVVATGGSAARLGQLPFEAWWLVVPALAIPAVFEFVDLPRDRIDNLGFALLMTSYGLLLAFCFANVRVRGMVIVTVGVALNTLVIGVNQGMPTRPEPHTTAAGQTVEKPIERTVKHRPESPDDLLGFLGDKIVLPDPIHEVLSPGDFVIAFGVIATCFLGSRRPRRRRGARRAAAPRLPEPPKAEPVAHHLAVTQPITAVQPDLRSAPRARRAPSRGDHTDPLEHELEQAYSRLAGAGDPIGSEPREAPLADDDDQPSP